MVWNGESAKSKGCAAIACMTKEIGMTVSCINIEALNSLFTYRKEGWYTRAGKGGGMSKSLAHRILVVISVGMMIVRQTYGQARKLNAPFDVD